MGQRPALATHEFPPPLSAVDLFPESGGMSLELPGATVGEVLGLEMRLAVEHDTTIATVYSANFESSALTADVQAIFDGDLGSSPISAERRIQKSVGRVDTLVEAPSTLRRSAP